MSWVFRSGLSLQGDNSSRQLGNGTVSGGYLPAAIPGAWVEVRALMYSTWAISGVDRAVYGWGLAVASSATPIRLVDPGPWLTLASGASESHVCGIKTDNTAWCWCANFSLSGAAWLSVSRAVPCPFYAGTLDAG